MGIFKKLGKYKVLIIIIILVIAYLFGMLKLTLISHIDDKSGNVTYKHQVQPLEQIVSKHTDFTQGQVLDYGKDVMNAENDWNCLSNRCLRWCGIRDCRRAQAGRKILATAG